MAIGQVLFWLGGAVAVIALLKRMMDNGRLLEPAQSKHKSHWAITGWFVPLLSLVRPYSVVKQIWNTGQLADAGSERELPESAKWWWGLFVTSLFIDRLSVTTAAPTTLDEFADEAIAEFNRRTHGGSMAGDAQPPMTWGSTDFNG